MCIEDLTKTIEEKFKNLSNDKQAELLRKAHIIDDEGYLDQKFFSAETISQNRTNGIKFI